MTVVKRNLSCGAAEIAWIECLDVLIQALTIRGAIYCAGGAEPYPTEDGSSLTAMFVVCRAQCIAPHACNVLTSLCKPLPFAAQYIAPYALCRTQPA